MSYQYHSHKGIPCQTEYCALPWDDFASIISVDAARAAMLDDLARAKERIFADDIWVKKDWVKMESEEERMTDAAAILLRGAAGLQDDEHGTDTPRRFAQMLRELTTPKPIKWKTFPNRGYDEMIIVRDIPFVSLCNHHVIPFMGKADIGYIPDQEVAGLSKFARVVHHFSRALQIQEQLTKQVADFLQENLKPLGVAVVMEAEHLCMTIRGAHVPGTKTYTAAMLGRFADHERTAKAEFLSRLNGH